MSRFASTSAMDTAFSDRFQSTIDVGEVLEYIALHFSPEDVFDTDDLSRWAEDNGYVKEDE